MSGWHLIGATSASGGPCASDSSTLQAEDRLNFWGWPPDGGEVMRASDCSNTCVQSTGSSQLI